MRSDDGEQPGRSAVRRESAGPAPRTRGPAPLGPLAGRTLAKGVLTGAVLLAGCVPPPPAFAPTPEPEDRPDDPRAFITPLDCPEAGGGPLFVDASADSGMDWQYEHAFTATDRWPNDFSLGLAADDFDGDGLPDLYVTNRAVSPSLYRNLGGGRFELVPDAGGADPGPLSTGASAADVDGDGDPDLLVMMDVGVKLYRNDGGTFVDVTEGSGLVGTERPIAVPWADLDGDGDLDAYVCSFFTVDSVATLDNEDLMRGADHLFINDGTGHFTDTPVPGIDAPSGCFAAAAVDFDADGLPEIATSYAKGEVHARDRLWVSNGDGWVDRAFERGLDFGHSGMGMAWGDFDGDGSIDLWKTNGKEDGDRLMLNQGDSFVDTTLLAGIFDPQRRATPHDADAWDFDDDGDLDVFVQLSTYPEPDGSAPVLEGEAYHELYWNDGARFTKTRSADDGVWATELSRAMVRADFDGDGAEDLAIPYWDAGLGLFLGRCSGASFLRVDLEGAPGNPRGIGARVVVEFGTRTTTQVVSLGGQTSSSQPPTLRFGLGSATLVDRVSVTFPSGEVVEVFDVPADSRLVVIQEP